MAIANINAEAKYRTGFLAARIKSKTPKRLKKRAKWASNPARLRAISQGETAVKNAANNPTSTDNSSLPSKNIKKMMAIPESADRLLTPRAVGPNNATKGSEK